MRAATSSRSQFLASVCIREPRDGQGVRDAMRDGLRVAQLGFCLVLHAASGLYARFRQVGSAFMHPAPNGLRGLLADPCRV